VLRRSVVVSRGRKDDLLAHTDVIASILGLQRVGTSL
jgi:hypothetical protein